MAFSAKKATVILSVYVLILISGCFGFLPESIKTCSRTDPNLDKCILDSVEELRPRLATGDFGDNFNVPRIEPLVIDTIEMKRGNEFHATFSNILVSGPSNFIVEKLKANANDLFFDFVILLPKLQFTGNYTLNIKLLLLNIAGKGDMKGSFKNARGYVKIQGNRVKKNGVDYVKFKTFQVKIKINESKLHLNNLFNGDRVLGEVGNQFINENSQLFLNEIIPGLEKSLAKTFTEVANSILETTTYDEMFPEK